MPAPIAPSPLPTNFIPGPPAAVLIMSFSNAGSLMYFWNSSREGIFPRKVSTSLGLSICFNSLGSVTGSHPESLELAGAGSPNILSSSGSVTSSHSESAITSPSFYAEHH